MTNSSSNIILDWAEEAVDKHTMFYWADDENLRRQAIAEAARVVSADPVVAVPVAACVLPSNDAVKPAKPAVAQVAYPPAAPAVPAADSPHVTAKPLNRLVAAPLHKQSPWSTIGPEKKSAPAAAPVGAPPADSPLVPGKPSTRIVAPKKNAWSKVASTKNVAQLVDDVKQTKAEVVREAAVENVDDGGGWIVKKKFTCKNRSRPPMSVPAGESRWQQQHQSRRSGAAGSKQKPFQNTTVKIIDLMSSSSNEKVRQLIREYDASFADAITKVNIRNSDRGLIALVTFTDTIYVSKLIRSGETMPQAGSDLKASFRKCRY